MVNNANNFGPLFRFFNSPFLLMSSSVRFIKFPISAGSVSSSLSLSPNLRRFWRRKNCCKWNRRINISQDAHIASEKLQDFVITFWTDMVLLIVISLSCCLQFKTEQCMLSWVHTCEYQILAAVNIVQNCQNHVHLYRKSKWKFSTSKSTFIIQISYSEHKVIKGYITKKAAFNLINFSIMYLSST